MLNGLVKLSLGRRGVVITLAVGFICYGSFVAHNAKLDVFPEFVQPQATVQTEAPGLAPEQVETLVTRPVESALNGAGNVDSIRSESIQGLSVVTVVFKEGTDIYIARQMLSERLVQVGSELPAGVKEPTMEPLTSSTMDLLKFGLTSEKLTPVELRTFADWTVRPRLLSVHGVAAVKTFGGEVQQLQIQLKPDRMTMFNVAVQDVQAAANEATGVRGAGFIETPAQRLVLQTEGQSITPEQLGNVVVAQRGNGVIRLKDVADVVIAGAPKFGDSIINGKPGILMTSASQYGANTMEVTRDIEKALEDLRPVFKAEGIDYVEALHRPATFIEIAIHNMKESLVLGAILVAIVLFLFLLDLRTALVAFMAIPLSLLTAVIVLDNLGYTLNTMTLGGMAAVLGVVVDDAIITVENILRRLRENTGLPQPRPMLPVVADATLEVRNSVVYATFVVAMVFIPVLLMTGLQGRFFAPLGLAFILANMASLVVALTVTPALCLALLSRHKPHEEPGYLRQLKAVHRGILMRISNWPKAIIAIALVAFLGAMGTLPFFGGEFLPDFREGHFVVGMTMTPGTSLAEMKRLGTHITNELLKNKNIKSVEEQIGRAEGGEDTWGPDRGEMHIELKKDCDEDQAKVQDEIRDVLSGYPGLQFDVQTFLGDRLGETMSGETAAVVVNVYGDDLDVLDAKAAEVQAVLNKIQGHADVFMATPTSPRLMIQLRPERLTQFGFRPVEVLEAVRVAYQGDVVSQVYEGDKVHDVAMILEPSARQQPETVGDLLVANSQGVKVPLKQLADVYESMGRNMINHDGARRRQTVTCNVTGRDVASFVAEAQQRVASDVKFPAGYYSEFSGAAEQQAAAVREMIIHSVAAAAGIIFLLSVMFRKAGHLLLVLANLPFALVGGVLAIFLTGMLNGGNPTISLGTLVGFVTLFGITMRNSIMMISHYQHLVTNEGQAWGLETALRGATERVIPILMTALVTALGLLPLALGSNAAGREVEGPMAIVILGGLVTSTALNLLVLPVLSLKYGKFTPEGTEEKK